MALVKLKTKNQVTIPGKLRQRLRIREGDLFEAKVERGKIVLTPQLIADRPSGDEYTRAQRRAIDIHVTEALQQAKNGETYGPFGTPEEMTAFLHDRAKRAGRAKTKTTKPRNAR